MAHIAIVGVGAIGGVVAALLETTGLHRITLCTRRPLEELIVETPEGVISMKRENITDPSAAEPVDWVMVATKAYDAKSTAAWLQRLCREDTPVAIIQNGVEHRENFSGLVRQEKLLPVIIDCPAERQEDDSIRLRGAVWIQVENNQLGSAFADLFKGSKTEVKLTDDFLTASWKKLCINAAGAIPALLMKPMGVLRDEGVGQIVLDIIAECVAVGKAEGADIDDSIGQQILDRYRSQPLDSINSILADRMAGRPMEVETRNGVIVRKGEQHGIGTPTNKMVVTLLKALIPSST